MLMTTTQTIGLKNCPEISHLIGYLASQQHLAYNRAVEILNQTPNIQKRAKKGSKRGLNKNVTDWGQEDKTRARGPYHIHQQRSETAWTATDC